MMIVGGKGDVGCIKLLRQNAIHQQHGCGYTDLILAAQNSHLGIFLCRKNMVCWISINTQH